MFRWRSLINLLITIICICISVPAYAAARAQITEGWYKIVPAHAQSKALDVGGAKTNPGANIQLWGYVGAPQQKFYVRHRGNNWYSIKAGNCDLYVDAQGGVPHRGENVHLWNWNGTDAQLWGFIDTGDGFNIVTKMQSDLVFDATGAGRSDGTNVQLWTRENVAWHRWILIPVEAPGSNTSNGESYVVSTNSASLLLRNGPGSGYGIKARMPRGSVVTVYSIQNGWAELSFNGTRGYASASYLTKQNSASQNIRQSTSSNSSVKSRLIEAVFHSHGKITCDFDGYKNTKGRHEGIDLVNYHKAPVYATVSGKVIRAGDGVYHTVSIYDTTNNKSIIYLHLDSSTVNLGQYVNKGDLIGYQGNYGAPQGSHVHIEVRNGKKTAAAKSQNDPILNNENPWNYWGKVL